MVPLRRLPVPGEPGSEVRYGLASWAKPNEPWYSVKYAWLDYRGHVCRGGEFPIGWGLTEAFIMAMESGQMGLTDSQQRRLHILVENARREDEPVASAA
jgi:hypothetical protein